jgi:uncharacterized protein with PIN domain
MDMKSAQADFTKGFSVVARFVADAMLGKLAKWLRVMGYDTIYRSRYRPGQIHSLVGEGRILLTRDTRSAREHEGGVFIRSEHVHEQLGQLKEEGCIGGDRAGWFTRCTICNEPLVEAPPEAARENVPEYVFFEHRAAIRYCPSCRRFFWSGSHRQKMVVQLEVWGF